MTGRADRPLRTTVLLVIFAGVLAVATRPRRRRSDRLAADWAAETDQL